MVLFFLHEFLGNVCTSKNQVQSIDKVADNEWWARLRFPRIFSIKKGSIVFRGYVKKLLEFFVCFW